MCMCVSEVLHFDAMRYRPSIFTISCIDTKILLRGSRLKYVVFSVFSTQTVTRHHLDVIIMIVMRTDTSRLRDDTVMICTTEIIAVRVMMITMIMIVVDAHRRQQQNHENVPHPPEFLPAWTGVLLKVTLMTVMKVTT